MSTYVCPEFAATGIELQIIELQVRREVVRDHGSVDEIATCDAEITRLQAELAQLAENHPDSVIP